jgi:hypothetical protein
MRIQTLNLACSEGLQNGFQVHKAALEIIRGSPWNECHVTSNLSKQGNWGKNIANTKLNIVFCSLQFCCSLLLQSNVDYIPASQNWQSWEKYPNSAAPVTFIHDYSPSSPSMPFKVMKTQWDHVSNLHIGWTKSWVQNNIGYIHETQFLRDKADICIALTRLHPIGTRGVPKWHLGIQKCCLGEPLHKCIPNLLQNMNHLHHITAPNLHSAVCVELSEALHILLLLLRMKFVSFSCFLWYIFK